MTYEDPQYLSEDQIEQLLKPIAGSRVLKLKRLSYVAQHDIRAHMNRIFGFARWSTDVIETAFLFEEENKDGNWKCGYRATVKVTVFAADGTELAHYTDSHASGNMPQPDKADAHALALTTAVSTAFKRACTNLGDQFGLSLYEKGSQNAIVKGTLVGASMGTIPEVEVTHGEEVTEATDEQVEMEKRTDDVASTLHTEMLDALRKLWTEEDDAARILGVASFKTEYAENLDDSAEFGGKQMTFARIADHIATKALVKS